MIHIIKYSFFYVLNFNFSLKQIKLLEYTHIKSDQDKFKFKNIEIIKPNYIDRIICYLRKNIYVLIYLNLKFKNIDTLDYQLWKYERSGKVVFYKAIFLHDLKKERFYGYVNPRSFTDKLLNYYYLWSGKY